MGKIMLIKKKIYNNTTINIVIFMGFMFFAIFANRSLILGENLMKWDIWQAEYPYQVLVSDALAQGQMILWNPLFQYGTPNYAIIGTPIWYPFTLLLALFGYTPSVLAFSYASHVALGGFGMYLLTRQELCHNDKASGNILITSVIAGLIYCSSGLFLSNAEHIMIIISAAWIPYVFFFMRKYAEQKQLVFAMLSGCTAGMIILGGYPELFYNTFLFLSLYTLFWTWDGNKAGLKTLGLAIKNVFVVGVFAILSGAITIIPFLNTANLLTRTSSTGQVPRGETLSALMTALFPNMVSIIPFNDVSMVNFYISILAILLIPIAVRLKNKYVFFYFGMAFFALSLCMCFNTFTHSVLYRFLPMYRTFRFPLLNRCFIAIFVILCVSRVLNEILCQKHISSAIKYAKYLFLFTLVCAFVSGLWGYTQAPENQSPSILFSNSAYVTTALLGAYILMFYALGEKDLKITTKRALLTGVILFELLTFHHIELSNTIALFSENEFIYKGNSKVYVDNEFRKNKERNRTTNFAGNLRSTNALDSQTIVFQKLFDEDGYVSVKLQQTQNFKKTFLRSIMEQCPEVYFTNDVVTSSEADYSVWAGNGTALPWQIYVEQEEKLPVTQSICFDETVLTSVPITWREENDQIHIQGTLQSGDIRTGRLRVFFNTVGEDPMTDLTVTYVDTAGKQNIYAGSYSMQQRDGQSFIDLYFPSVDTAYSDVYIENLSLTPEEISLVTTDRLHQDSYTNVTYFGFNDIAMTVDAPSDGFVAILQAKFRGWTAYLDGQKTEISLIDQCFMGIKVTEGTHHIVLKFRPYDFYLGLTITVSFFVLLIAVLIYNARRYKAGSKPIEADGRRQR